MDTNRKARIRSVPIILFFLTSSFGCVAPTKATETVVIPTNSPPVLSQRKVTHTYDFQEQVEPTLTPKVSLTSSPTTIVKPARTSSVIPMCSQEGNVISPPEDFRLTGTLIYQVEGRLGLYATEGSALIHTQLIVPKTEQVFVIGFSPNGKLLAYVPIIKNPASETSIRTPSIVILSEDGKKTEWDLNYGGMEGDDAYGEYLYGISEHSYWINDQLIYTTLVYNYLDPYTFSTGVPKLFDPFRGNWVEEPLQYLRDRRKDQYLQFSPDLKRVLYASTLLGQNNGMILWDVERDQILWSDPSFSADYSQISWSPNGSMVAVANLLADPEERALFFLSKDGEETENVLSLLPPGNFRIFDVGWSPDSRYLAVVVVYDEISFQIYIYDTMVPRFVFSCPITGIKKYPPTLIWSPDGSSIALSHSLGSPLLILNIKTGETVNLIQNAIAVGWSDQFPVEWP